MENKKELAAQIRDELKKRKIPLVYLNFIGPDGKIGTKCSLTGLEKELLYTSFLDGVAVNGRMVKGWEEEPNAEWLLLLPDITTIRYTSAEHGDEAAIAMGSFPGYELDPRLCAERVTRYALSMGFTPMCGTSVCYETLNIAEDTDAFKILPFSPMAELNMKIAQCLQNMEIKVEYFQPVDRTHHVIDLVPDLFLPALDKNALSRWFVSAFCKTEDVDIRYSSPQSLVPICETAVHMSLWNADRNSNLFFDADDEMELSITGKQFIAGILRYFNELTTIIQLSAETGYSQSWRCSFSDRRDDSIIHIPVYFKERKKHDRVGWGKRILFNGFLQDCNLHICASAVMLAGLEGIRNNLEPKDYTQESLKIMKPEPSLLCDDNIFRSVLGNDVIDWIMKRGTK